jgi:hypothetical protein
MQPSMAHLILYPPPLAWVRGYGHKLITEFMTLYPYTSYKRILYPTYDIDQSKCDTHHAHAVNTSSLHGV